MIATRRPHDDCVRRSLKLCSVPDCTSAVDNRRYDVNAMAKRSGHHTYKYTKRVPSFQLSLAQAPHYTSHNSAEREHACPAPLVLVGGVVDPHRCLTSADCNAGN